MQFDGYLPEGAPDPRVAQSAKVKLLVNRFRAERGLAGIDPHPFADHLTELVVAAPL
ncbi:hypothetical protein [Agreia bicolorata]|uniref:hypothetical protein n=1 Tax=Agreia bicolorata TaxID=110935 RepID=UPI000A7FD6D5|nr:hypothetical protein [Agreia bicolorata]